MLTFQRAKWMYAAGVTAFFATQFWMSISFWWLVLLTVVFAGLIAYGVFFIQAGFFLFTLNGATTSEKKIALTFDDGPNAAVTPQLLELLKKHHIKATFFCIGKHIETSPEIVNQIDSEGHIVANHTYSHDRFIDIFSPEKFRDELIKTETLIKETLQRKPLLFRPPYGITNPNICLALDGLGYTTVGWNLRSLDTVIKDDEKLFERIRKRIRPGAVVLLHDNNIRIIEVVKKIILYCAENGIAIVRLDELLNVQAYE